MIEYWLEQIELITYWIKKIERLINFKINKYSGLIDFQEMIKLYDNILFLFRKLLWFNYYYIKEVVFR